MLPFGDMKASSKDADEKVWKALADPVRRSILDQLATGPKTTGELVLKFDHLCRTAVMKHLQILVGANLVVAVKSGRIRLNCINPVPLAGVCERWLNSHTKRMSQSLARLKEIVELPPDSGG